MCSISQSPETKENVYSGKVMTVKHADRYKRLRPNFMLRCAVGRNADCCHKVSNAVWIQTGRKL